MAGKQRSVGIRRNARTANFHWQDDSGKAEESTAAYSIVRPGFCQFELFPIGNKQHQQMGNAVGSVDSGTASALHSPRNALSNENSFPQFN
jgi:hypothetical protein